MNLLSKGRRKQIRGRIREGVGKLTGNKRRQFSGRLERFEGTTRLKLEKVAKKVRKRF